MNDACPICNTKIDSLACWTMYCCGARICERECIAKYTATHLQCPCCHEPCFYAKHKKEKMQRCPVCKDPHRMHRMVLENHVSKLLKQVVCDKCSEKVQVRHWDKHTEYKCKNLVVPCPLHGCSKDVPARLMRSLDDCEDQWPEQMWQHHRCSGVFRCEKCGKCFGDMEKLSKHEINEHDLYERKLRRREKPTRRKNSAILKIAAQRQKRKTTPY